LTPLSRSLCGRSNHPYGSIWRKVRTSASLTSVNFFNLRMRPGFFVPSKCRLPECIRLIFPDAVILKRLRAPRCVFNFFLGFVEFRGIPLLPLVYFFLLPTSSARRAKSNYEA
jgi:hypothetical protein